MALSTADHFKLWLARRIIGTKQAELPLVRQSVIFGMLWSWLEPSFERMVRDGFLANAAVFSCINALNFAAQQPKPVVKSLAGDPLPNHPLQALLNRPNAFMGWAELSLYITTYKAIGGQCFLHKVPSSGPTMELYPYHLGHITAEPSRADWIGAYVFGKGTEDEERIDPKDIIHLKWPSVDPEHPWLALPPLRAVAREVDTDAEATRYIWALLKNDATPRTVINLVKEFVDPIEMQQLRESFHANHGGDNRGGVAITTGGAKIDRMGLNLQELAFDALRRVPEARIASAFRVPPIVAGLNVGLERSTYANFEEARRMFLEDTVMQLLNLDAGELTADLASEFGSDIRVEFDYSAVIGLGENRNDLVTRATTIWQAGVGTLNEARQIIGLPPAEKVVPGVDGNVFKAAPQLPAPPPDEIDVTPRALAVEREAENEADDLEEEQEQRKHRDNRQVLARQLEQYFEGKDTQSEVATQRSV